MPARWYRVDMPHERPLVSVLVLDSNIARLGEDDWQRQLDWLRQQLSGPGRPMWTICLAHHPLFSDGMHGDSRALQRDWGPLFRQYGVDFYVSGHDHDLQHLKIRDWDTDFLVAGGGGAGTRPRLHAGNARFFRSTHGFVHLQATSQWLEARFICAVGGDLLYKVSRTRP